MFWSLPRQLASEADIAYFPLSFVASRLYRTQTPALSPTHATQEDATRLANRLAQLKKEEERSQKRIEETRKRAAEILNARRRNGTAFD